MIEKFMVLALATLLGISSFSCDDPKVNTEARSGVKETDQTTKPDSSYLFLSKVQTIFQDSQGNYWLGSRENGLCKYDGESYTYFTMADGLPSNSVPYIQEDAAGNIWLDNTEAITKYDGKEFLVYDKTFIPTVDINKHPVALSKNDLWFRDTKKVGIYRYDGKELTFISFEDPPLNLTPHHSHFFVSDITDVVDGETWFGTIMQGAVGFDGRKFEKITDASFDFDSDAEFLHIRSMLLDSKGNLWIGNNGIGVILKQQDTLIHFSKEQGRLLSMAAFEMNGRNGAFVLNTGLQSVFAIEEDANGHIWFGDRDSGVWEYDGEELRNYNSIYSKNDLSELVWDIYCDRSGRLFFILVGGEVFTFNGESFETFDGF
ncbi:MAG: two-component regulator propeller domain-containing protein [Bacteroidota bacterium]